MTFHFYNPTDKPIKITSLGKLVGKAEQKELFTVTLQPGYNTVVANTKGNDWTKYPLEYMLWSFEQDGEAMYSDVTLYLKDIIVYEA